jgi:hypothetical protein
MLKIDCLVGRHRPPLLATFIAPDGIAAPRWEDLDSEIELPYLIDRMYMAVEIHQTILSHERVDADLALILRELSEP